MAEEKETPEKPFFLSGEEREVLEAEVEELLRGLPPERHGEYAQVREELGRAALSAQSLPWLERVVSLALLSGRARRAHRAEGERILTQVFERTPAGRELRRELHSVNAALRALEGQPMQGVRVGMRTLGHFTVSIETEQTTITLAVRSHGVAVDSVTVGAGN